MPFAALVDEQQRYLVERFTFSYLTSGRDLLQLAVPSPVRDAPLVVANPQFDRPGEAAARLPATIRAADLSRARFVPLPGTAGEAAAIGPLLPGATVLTGSQATERAVKSVHGPRVLHVATHGFFLDATTQASVKEGRLLVMDAAPSSRTFRRAREPVAAVGPRLCRCEQSARAATAKTASSRRSRPPRSICGARAWRCCQPAKPASARHAAAKASTDFGVRS